MTVHPSDGTTVDQSRSMTSATASTVVSITVSTSSGVTDGRIPG
ncbi:MAG TPA: hypothetical protein VFZ79_17160 [Acidimicrobiales bacterium]